MSKSVGFEYVDVDDTWHGFDLAGARAQSGGHVCAECKHWRYIKDSFINSGQEGALGAQGLCLAFRRREASHCLCGRCYEARPVTDLASIPCVQVIWPE